MIARIRNEIRNENSTSIKTVADIAKKYLPTPKYVKQASSEAELFQFKATAVFLQSFQWGYQHKKSGIWGESPEITVHEGREKTVTYYLRWRGTPGVSELADKVKAGKLAENDSDLLSQKERGALYSSIIRSLERLAGEKVGGNIDVEYKYLGFGDKKYYVQHIVAGLYLLDMLGTPNSEELLRHLLDKEPVVKGCVHEVLRKYAPETVLKLQEGGGRK